MSNFKMAVVVIHGMGSQFSGAQQPSSVLTFSKELRKRVARFVGSDMGEVAWREIVWAHVLQGRQGEYLRRIKRRTGYDDVRSFVVRNLSDAASYRQTPDGTDQTYEDIHAEVDRVMEDVRRQVGNDAPVLLLAHSLGGHIMSNYIYDLQRHEARTGQTMYASPVRNMQTVAGIMTFGCNIPIFLFAYPEDSIKPIDPPNSALPAGLKFRTWWYNFFDKHDVLGYPMRDSAPAYDQLVASQQLRDVSINSGNIFTSWNPFSHNGYWKDPDLYEPVGRMIRNMLRAL
ncbi:hypothetical protein AVO45_02225 [Ruegeria marisrubri]|uniref:AB hydrolase-1 domain-containing protein n=1 Tax=Ruegeria marisrubri TaxID=1685379 RepID=A0A101CYN3_9RHOB|nr:alpha/beta fold hydrolase [Ruegeria marisrubri]KUJ85817.1 hypothetical protein AVO45_02225 [Ruegeria marisrubri]